MHVNVNEVRYKIGVKRAGQTVAGLGKVAWLKNARKYFFSAKDEQVQGFGRRSALRASLLSLRQVDIKPAVCEGQQTEIKASEASHVSFGRSVDSWPSLTCESACCSQICCVFEALSFLFFLAF